MASQADVRRVENLMEDAPDTFTVPFVDELTWWDRLKLSITPESHAESVVNAIYSTPANTLKTDPYYDQQDLGSPNVFVAAKGAVSDVFSAASGFGKNILIIAVVGIVLAIAVHAGVTAFVRR